MGTAANPGGGRAGCLRATLVSSLGAKSDKNCGLRPTASGLTIVEADAVPSEIKGCARNYPAQLNSRR